MKYALRMTGTQHQKLRSHLFPGDGMEAVALLLCGRRNGRERHIFTVMEVLPIPHDVCDRQTDRITWPTNFVDDLVNRAYGKDLAIVKVHSHTSDYAKFSETDDESDRQMYSAVTSLLDDKLPHASMIMLPGGKLIGRVHGDEGKILAPLELISAVGDDLHFWTSGRGSSGSDAFALRQLQAFGAGTIEILRNLSIALVGCSGTGSLVAEQLARLGVGRLLLVDPDIVELKNLNRIVNSGVEDAYLGRAKVNVLAKSIARIGIGQNVIPLQQDLIRADSIKAVAECDVVFGCMDGVEGRHWLNRLATFYTLPYFDVGVRLDADGFGGISQISGAAHYLQPGRSSLLSRGVYNLRQVDAEAMRRTDPEMYRRQVDEGYLRGVEEDRPAVISVNMLFASLVVNDFLARLHPYRNHDNSQFGYIGGNLCEVQLFPESEDGTCDLLRKHVGRGDVAPLLERAALS